MTTYALRLENATDTAPRVRMGDALAMAGGLADRLAAHSGVRPGGGAVTVNGGTMQVQVAAFSGWLQGGSTVGQSGYAVVCDDTVTLTLTDGHPTLDRVDTVALVVHDNAFDSSTLTDCAVTVVEGTPGGGAPILPTTCLPLRSITVPHGVSAGTGGLTSGNLGNDLRTYTAALGGLLPVASATERDALTPYAGMPVYRLDIKHVEVWNGTSWDDLNGNDTGWVPAVLLASTSFVTGTGSQVRKIGNRVTIELVATSGSFVNAGTGNIADKTLCTLPAGFRPSADVHVWYSTTKAGGAAVIKPTGEVQLRTLYEPGFDWNDGDHVYVHAQFLTD